MYAPSGVKTNHNEVPVPESMRAWGSGMTGTTPDKWARAWRERGRERLRLVPVTEEEQEDVVRRGERRPVPGPAPGGHRGAPLRPAVRRAARSPWRPATI